MKREALREGNQKIRNSLLKTGTPRKITLRVPNCSDGEVTEKKRKREGREMLPRENI